jgi:hypothetical protein
MEEKLCKLVKSNTKEHNQEIIEKFINMIVK